MKNLDELQENLTYVRAAVERSEHDPSPRAIYLLWAAIVLVGFPLVDLAPQAVGWYWSLAGPIGGLVSFWLGYRDSRRRGGGDPRIGIRHALHWVGMLVAIWLIIPLAATGRLEWDALSPAILVVVGLGWYLAGVHLDRPLLWMGLLMLLGYPVVLLVQGYAWTLLGVLVAAGLAVTAWVMGRSRAVDA